MAKQLITLADARNVAGWRTALGGICPSLFALLVIAVTNTFIYPHDAMSLWIGVLVVGATGTIYLYITGQWDEKYQWEYLNWVVESDKKLLQRLDAKKAGEACSLNWHKERKLQAEKLLESPWLIKDFRKIRKQLLKDVRDLEPAEKFPLVIEGVIHSYSRGKLLEEIEGNTELGQKCVYAVLKNTWVDDLFDKKDNNHP